MSKCNLSHRRRHAPGARSSGSWGISPQSPTSARPATYGRSISFALAAGATKLCRSASCEKSRKAAGCATSARPKRCLTDVPPAHDTNRPQNSRSAGETWKQLTTLAARAARRASSASVASQTTAPWLQTRGCVGPDLRKPTARGAQSAKGFGKTYKHPRIRMGVGILDKLVSQLDPA